MVQIPDNFELVEDPEYMAKTGDLFTKVNDENYLGIMSGYESYNLLYLKKYCFIKELYRYREKPLTPEEKTKIAKQKSKSFVDKHISEPSKKIYENFERIFLREDNFGL